MSVRWTALEVSDERQTWAARRNRRWLQRGVRQQRQLKLSAATKMLQYRQLQIMQRSSVLGRPKCLKPQSRENQAGGSTAAGRRNSVLRPQSAWASVAKGLRWVANRRAA